MLPAHPGHVPIQLFDLAWILADEDVFIVSDGGGNGTRHAAVATLAPTDQAVVGLDLDEYPRSPASITDERFDLGDAHGSLPSRFRVALAPHPQPLSRKRARGASGAVRHLRGGAGSARAGCQNRAPDSRLGQAGERMRNGEQMAVYVSAQGRIGYRPGESGRNEGAR